MAATINEVWKLIKEFPGYQVSNLGRVKSTRKGKEVIIRPSSNGAIPLYRKGSRSTVMARRLMYSTFHDIELSRLKDVRFIGDTLDTIQAFSYESFLTVITERAHSVTSPDLIEERQRQMLDDTRIILKAWDNEDAAELTHRVLSYKDSTVEYIIRYAHVSKARSEEIWHFVSSTLIIRIMNKEITVSGFQGWLKTAARYTIQKKRQSQSRLVSYDDNRLVSEYNW